MLGKRYENQNCAIASTLEVLGERWTLLIVRDAFLGVRRFNDFAARLDIPRAVLAERLRGLADNGVLEKWPDPEHSGRSLYELTPAGKDLWPMLYDLISWGSEHRHRSSSAYRHALCGTELTTGARCPECELTPPPEEVLKIPRRGTRPSRGDSVSRAIHRRRRLLEPV